MTPRLSPGVRRHLAALRALLVLTLVCGVVYPMAMTGIAQVVAHDNADGSLVHRHGTTVGSDLIGQDFTAGRAGVRYFQSRPSAAGDGYDAMSSSASNLGPENDDLVELVRQRRDAVARLDGTPPAKVAPDALLASGSGLDPQISPEYARQQVSRVARARQLSASRVEALVDEHVQGRTLGFLGEPRVNVLRLNLALDAMTDS